MLRAFLAPLGRKVRLPYAPLGRKVRLTYAPYAPLGLPYDIIIYTLRAFLAPLENKN